VPGIRFRAQADQIYQVLLRSGQPNPERERPRHFDAGGASRLGFGQLSPLSADRDGSNSGGP
jgi:hypothetical protein